MKPERVIIVPYDPEWPRRFQEERAILEEIFAAPIVIEHIGSTSVPGLGGKPIVDVMVGMSDLTEAEKRTAALQSVGYDYVKEYETQIPDRRYFRKPRVVPRAIHLHCVVKEGVFWSRHLAFRNYLRAHPESAAAYYELKQDLAMRVQKEDYTEAKSPFIEGILVRGLGLAPVHEKGGS
jgi:GrpB-like predicted nucleotidyltransferase (UPF0157 family)